MALTVFQQILAAIDARLRAILVSGGYGTDAGENVFYWRTSVLSSDTELPAIVYQDTGEKSSGQATFGALDNLAALAVKCFACGADDATVKASLDQMYADVMKAIGVDETWGGLAIWTEKLAHTIAMEEKEKIIGYVLIEFEISYRHVRWNVYTKM